MARRARQTLPLSPLTPVRRRRRGRRRRPLALLATLLLVAVGLAAWWLPERDRGGEARARSEQDARLLAAAPPPERTAAGEGRRTTARAALLVDARRRARFRPPLGAKGAILIDAADGRVLWARSPNRRLRIASTTKIMTALLALERLRPNDVVTVAPSVARVAPYREGLRAGERVQAWKLLYGLMLYSGNDDALALALATAGSRPAFVRLMNERARELGLRRTHFSTPSGVIDRDNYSTASDLAVLARHALRKPRFRAIVRTRRKRVRWAAPTYSKVYVNKNPLLGTYRGADGVKTGWTSLAGDCLVASATRDGVRLIAVVLGSRDAVRAARRLLDFGFREAGRRR